MKQIFLVEDDKEIAKNLARLLFSEGFTVTHASTQREAVTMLANNKFDLALVDISPVSYTHLDVYKRQVPTYSYLFFIQYYILLNFIKKVNHQA